MTALEAPGVTRSLYQRVSTSEGTSIPDVDPGHDAFGDQTFGNFPEESKCLSSKDILVSSTVADLDMGYEELFSGISDPPSIVRLPSEQRAADFLPHVTQSQNLPSTSYGSPDDSAGVKKKHEAFTRSPSDGDDVRWYFCKSPLHINDLAAAVPATAVVGKGEFLRFSWQDSLALETEFLDKEEELVSLWWKEYAECSVGPSKVVDREASKDSNEAKDSAARPFNRTTSDYYNEEAVGVPVKGGLYEVDLAQRRCFPVYWNGEHRRVLRGLWFARKGGLDWLPLREDIAEQIEFAYRSRVWRRRTFQPSGQFAARIDLHGVSQGLHALFTGEEDTWEAWMDTDTSGFSSIFGLKGSAYRLRRGFAPSGAPQPTQEELTQRKEDEIDDYCSQVPVRHLVFMVHGIGQRLEKANLVDDVGTFRRIVADLAEKHLTPYQRNHQRVLFIPCQWRRHLKLGGEQAVEDCTLEGVRTLRTMISATVHDVLYYMSPVYCQDIIDSVSASLNGLYQKFIRRNPDYNGKVSVYGHSLGSVLSYDILCHQETLTSSFPIQRVSSNVSGTVEDENSGLTDALNNGLEQAKTPLDNGADKVISGMVNSASPIQRVRSHVSTIPDEKSCVMDALNNGLEGDEINGVAVCETLSDKEAGILASCTLSNDIINAMPDNDAIHCTIDDEEFGIVDEIDMKRKDISDHVDTTSEVDAVGENILDGLVGKQKEEPTPLEDDMATNATVEESLHHTSDAGGENILDDSEGKQIEEPAPLKDNIHHTSDAGGENILDDLEGKQIEEPAPLEDNMATNAAVEESLHHTSDDQDVGIVKEVISIPERNEGTLNVSDISAENLITSLEGDSYDFEEKHRKDTIDLKSGYMSRLAILEKEMAHLRAQLVAIDESGTSIQLLDSKFSKDNNCDEGSGSMSSISKKDASATVCIQNFQPNASRKHYTPQINYTKLNFKVDTFFAVGSPLGLFLSLRKVRIGMGNGREYWKDEGIEEEMPACRQMMNIFHPYDPVAFRVEPLVSKEYVERRPVFVPYHKGGKRIHIQMQEIGEKVSAQSTAVVHSLASAGARMTSAFCSSTTEKSKDQQGDSDNECEDQTYGSLVMEKLTGSQDGRVDFMLQDATFEHQYISAISSHTSYWRDLDTALFIVKHLYIDIPREPPDAEQEITGRVFNRSYLRLKESIVADDEMPITFCSRKEIFER